MEGGKGKSDIMGGGATYGGKSIIMRGEATCARERVARWVGSVEESHWGGTSAWQADQGSEPCWLPARTSQRSHPEAQVGLELGLESRGEGVRARVEEWHGP